MGKFESKGSTRGKSSFGGGKSAGYKGKGDGAKPRTGGGGNYSKGPTRGTKDGGVKKFQGGGKPGGFKKDGPGGGFKKDFKKDGPGGGFKKDFKKEGPGGGFKKDFKKEGPGGGFKKDFKKDGPKKPLANLSKKEKKQMKIDKKVQKNPKLSRVQPAVKIWEKIRPESVPGEQRREGIQRIYAEIKGTIADLSTNHSMSRIIQFMLAHGAPEVTAAVAVELEGKMLDLSESTFGHFISKKMIENATKNKEKLTTYMRIFKGHVAKLLRHPCGSTVIDELYRAGNAQQQAAMASELYGPEFALFTASADASIRLGDLLASEPLKRRSIIANLSANLIPIVEKGLVDASIAHRLIAEYLEFAPPLAALEVADNLASPTVMRMLHTREGARAACLAAAALGAKGRKSFVKALKGHVVDICKDETGHVLILALLSFVDDTTLLRKFIVAEILGAEGALKELCGHRFARRIVLQLLCPDSLRYQVKDWLPLMHPTPRAVTPQDLKEREEAEEKRAAAPEPKAKKKAKKSAEGAEGDEKAAAGEGSDEEDGGASSSWRVDEINVSRKNATQRRKEVLGSAAGKGGEGSLAARLVATVTEHVGEFLRDQQACDVVLEVARGGGADGLLIEACGCSAVVAELQDAIVAAVQQSAQEEDPLLQSWWGSRTLRRLIALGAEEGAAEASRAACAQMAAKLYTAAVQGNVAELAENKGAGKVVAALATCGDAATAAAVRKELQGKFKSAAGVDAFLQQFEKKEGGEKPAAKGPAPATATAKSTPAKVTPAKVGGEPAAAAEPVTKKTPAQKTPGGASAKKGAQTPVAAAAAAAAEVQAVAATPVARSGLKRKATEDPEAVAPAAAAAPSTGKKAKTPATAGKAQGKAGTPASAGGKSTGKGKGGK